MTPSKINEMTLREIATATDLNYFYIQRLSREKNFPDPVKRIGVNKIYDGRRVLAFFDARRRKRRKAA
jgi:hypothetical protein